jgi:serine/threonine-protein kinase
VFDYGETDEVAYIVMEFVDGRTLKSLLDKGERLPPDEILRVMTALLDGLQYSHDKGVVHRDVKPANVMLTGQGQVKIADFGIARIDSSNMTQVGTVLGTPAYMSPEQFMGHAVDRRTDIYSAGVLLYQLVTGERPFEGTISGIMHKALHTEAARLSTVAVTAPAGLDAVVAKAMSKRPEDRFGSAAAFAAALRGAFAGVSFAGVSFAGAGDGGEATVVSVRRAVPDGVVRKRRPSGRAIAGVVLLLVAGAGGAGWYLFGQRPADRLADRAGAGRVDAVAGSGSTTAGTPDAVPIAPARAGVTEPPVRQSEKAAPLAVDAAPLAAGPPAAAPVVPGPLLPPPPPRSELATLEPAKSVAPAGSGPAGLVGLAEARALALEIPCSLIDVSETRSANVRSRLLVSGPMLPNAAFDTFIGRLRGPDRLVDVTTDRLDGAQCGALEAVADRVRLSRTDMPLRVVVPDAPVEVGGRLSVAVEGVSAGALSIDLYSADGSVHHLLQRVVPAGAGGEIRATAPAVGPPGPGLVVALATAAPLGLSQRPASESGSGYLAALQGELARVPAAQAEIGVVSISPSARPVAAASGGAPGRPRAAGLSDARCADIVSRFQLGEALSDADRSVLQSSCRR